MSSEELLLVFVKNPRRGNVKTRLAESVGEEQALQIYQQLMHYTQEIVKPLAVDVQVWYSDYIPLNDLWDEVGAAKRTQQGRGLGAKMHNAFSRAFAEGYKRPVIIGSDCAELTTETLHKAFEELKEQNIVIGPSEDGGYYLLGMDQLYGDLFENKGWSTPTVFNDTVRDIEKLGLSFSELSSLNDVDTLADWQEVEPRFADS